jgi:hypothetical protein
VKRVNRKNHHRVLSGEAEVAWRLRKGRGSRRFKRAGLQSAIQRQPIPPDSHFLPSEILCEALC